MSVLAIAAAATAAALLLRKKAAPAPTPVAQPPPKLAPSSGTPLIQSVAATAATIITTAGSIAGLVGGGGATVAATGTTAAAAGVGGAAAAGGGSTGATATVAAAGSGFAAGAGALSFAGVGVAVLAWAAMTTYGLIRLANGSMAAEVKKGTDAFWDKIYWPTYTSAALGAYSQAQRVAYASAFADGYAQEMVAAHQRNKYVDPQGLGPVSIEDLNNDRSLRNPWLEKWLEAYPNSLTRPGQPTNTTGATKREAARLLFKSHGKVAANARNYIDYVRGGRLPWSTPANYTKEALARGYFTGTLDGADLLTQVVGPSGALVPGRLAWADYASPPA